MSILLPAFAAFAAFASLMPWPAECSPAYSTPPGFAHLIDSASIYAQRVLQVLREHDTSKPLFVYMAFQSVHFPIQVPAKYVAPYIHLDSNRQQFAGMLAALDEAVGVIVGGFKDRGIWEHTIVIFSTVSDLCVLRACRSVCVFVDDVPMSVCCVG